MKKTSTNNSILRIALNLFVAFAVVFTLYSCKDKEEDEFENVTVQFKVSGNDYDTIKAVVTQVGTQQNTAFNITGSSWTSEKMLVNTSVGALHLSATADGELPSAKMDVSILVNGQEKSKGSSTGSSLNATTSLQLYQQYK